MPQSSVIDLRSDTVTQPTDEMRDAAAAAVLGDDVFGDDPTVIELEAYAAKLLGKEAALFVTSGTQGNLVSLLSHTKLGDEVLLEKESHIYNYEVGGVSAIAGIFPRTFESEKGFIEGSKIRSLIRAENIHYPDSTLFCLENTHNRHGGVALSPEEISEMTTVIKEYDLKIHLDGARIFNATAYHNTDVKNYTKNVDSINVCLSKGLSAPIGSIVAGNEEFVQIARKKRKMLGGGMRQVGIIAAPGLIALRDMRERLVIDHIHARQLAEGLTENGVNVWPTQTNIVVCDISKFMKNSTEAVERLKSKNVLSVPFGNNLVRLTTHRHIIDSDIEEVIDIVSKVWFE
ncbi:MAG: aminotransferase class I/II-fold pyridoxal phosphate-dependent enzyme [Candidatus Heimdallarchaeota archaeon]|nr:aminotransferase class I/II-fold pyridoxal phosphate-dependent enzyme [Candidatus Heimdallarchaeota archaeon]